MSDDYYPMTRIDDIPMTRLDDVPIHILDEVQSSMSPSALVNSVFMMDAERRNVQ